MPFPQTRLRRLRSTHALRGLVRETRLDPADFVYPMFVAHGLDRREPIPAMPGIDRLSIAHAVAAPRGMHLSIIEVQPEAPPDENHKQNQSQSDEAPG